MIGDNVTNDFLDNLAAEQYRKMHKKKELDLFEVIPKWKEWKESLNRKAHRDNIKALQREIEELKAEIVVLKASKHD